MASLNKFSDVSKQKLPNIQHDIRKARAFLQKYSPAYGDNLYDHLSELLSKILTERPKNAVENFEIYSYRIKEERFKKQLNHQEIYNSSIEFEEAEKLTKLFQSLQVQNEDDEQEDEDDKNNENIINNKSTNTSVLNLFDLIYFLDSIDVGLPKFDSILIDLSIRQLLLDKPITSVRFWGKILGSSKNYYIIEAKLNQDEIQRRLKAPLASSQTQNIVAEAVEEDISTENEGYDFTNEIKITNGIETVKDVINFALPKNELANLQAIPEEPIGIGLNNMIYFACNSPGLDKWIELPSVTPAQIMLARQIVWHFTGCLTTQIRTFPSFPGDESNYLRAQIARISAATLVSPTGYFIFAEHLEADSEDEETYEEETTDNATGDTTIVLNTKYKAQNVRKYKSLSNWCHHSSYIFDQGRINWWNPSTRTNKQDDEDATEDEESEEDTDNTSEISEKVTGPLLLTPISEDTAVDIPVWNARVSSSVLLDSAVAAVRSNVWPGAIAFTKNKDFGNAYIGTGHKYNTYNYSPPITLPIQNQYAIGPEIMEIQDPTVEEEQMI